MDLFTPEFKRLKARNPPPSLEDVIDLHTFDELKQSTDLQASNLTFESIHNLYIKCPHQKEILGLKPCADWKVFKFDHYPGFTVILNPFVDGYQRYWVTRCLQDFPSNRKNVTNLSALGDLDSFDLWSNFVQQKKTSLAKDDPLRKLRWTTLGYHYDWTSKEYSEERKAEFPPDIQRLTQYFSDCLNFGPYKAEAAIVNYYHLDSTLAGHTDHSELDHEAPLFSISFGQTAIFMLGGHTKADKPMSIFLRSGDICVMSGPCRLAYHAVPRILSSQAGRADFSCFHTDGDAFKNVQHESDATGNSDLCSKVESNSSQYVLKCSDGTRNSHNKSETNSCESVVLKDNSSDSLGDVNSQSISSIESPFNCKTYGASKDSLTLMDTLNKNISDTLHNLDWNPFDVYLQSSRINLNVRQVFPIGCDTFQTATVIVNDSKKLRLEQEKDVVSSNPV